MVMTYDYRCDQCESAFQVRRDWNTNAGSEMCPKCNSIQVHRIYTSFMVLSRSSDGSLQDVGGNSCGGCAASSCAGCASSK